MIADPEPTEAAAREYDSADPLATFRDRFTVPDDLYLDGNSLGPVSAEAEAALELAIDQWRRLGIRAWTDADPPWFEYGERLGDRLAPHIGARDHEVVAANSTTVNIHTLIGTVLDADGVEPPVLVDELDFPTDHYAIRAQLRQRGYDPEADLVVVESRDGRTIAESDVIDAMDAHEPGIVFLPSVLYRSGQLLDIQRLTEAAHERDILAGFDLAHSVGVVPHDLSAVGVDFAVWCHYKYLNAGPGAIGGLYVHERHHGLTPALAGWWGHDKATQFEMQPRYTPASGAGAWQIGTVNVFSAAPLFGALDVLDEAGIERVREGSLDRTAYLLALVDEHLVDTPYEIGTPREPDRRGGHVAIEHPAAERISRALRDRGVIVDYRPPNVIRVCPAPLYVGFQEVYRAVEHLAEIEATGEYEQYGDDGTVS